MEEFLELKSENEWREGFPALNSLRSKLTESEFLKRRETLLNAGYRLFGLKTNGKIVAVASADLYPHVADGVNCWVHDLATVDGERSKGYGAKLMQNVERWAKQQGCTRLAVHTRVEREKAQNFYEQKLGYPKTAITYYKEL